MTPSTRAVQFAFSERIAHLDAAAWDAVSADAGVFLGRPFLSALERARPANLQPRYALLYRNEQPIAAACLQLVHVEGPRVVGAETALGGVAQLVNERAIVLGNLAAWGNTGLAIAPGADPTLVWREGLRLLDRVRRFEKPGAINVSFVKDAAHYEEASSLRDAGYQQAPTGPDMVLEFDQRWTAFSDYTASLASKRRRAVKKIFEDLEGAGYVTRRLELEDLEQHEARIDALYSQVWANAGVRPLRLTGRFFVELKRELGDDCVVLGLERDSRLDGFGVTLRSGSTCVGYYLGFEREADAPLYLRLLLGIVEQGIAWRCTRASMGRTAEEPKSRLGAVAGARGLWVKHRTPPLNWAVGAILGAIEPAEIAGHRVFRSA